MRYAIFISFCLFINLIYPQVNIVPNYSFEQFTNCPNNYGQIYFATPWFQPNIYNGNTTNSSSTEYFNECTSTIFSVPNNSNGVQFAKTGVAYGGFSPYTWQISGFREYLEVELDSTLIVNRKYCAEFYLSLSDNVKYATDAMGIYFSNDSILDSSNYQNLPYIPQISNPIGNFLTDKNGWMKISGIYIPNGGEKFITIGNFNDDANTDTIFVGNGGYEPIYYFIDDVSVYEIDEIFPANLAGPNKTICKDSTVIIGSSAINGFKYLWLPAAGLSSDTVAQPTAAPAQTTTYILQIINDSVPYSCKPTTTDTVTVTIKPLPVFAITATDDSVCTGDSVILSAPTTVGAYQWSTGDTTSSLTVYPLTDSMFFATATDNGCSYADSVLINTTLTPTAGIIATDTVICSGETTTLTASGGTNYLWSTEDTTTSITTEPANNTIYHLTAFNENCYDEDSVSITVLPLPDSANILSETITIFIGEDTMLESLVSVDASISWSPHDFLSCTTCVNPIANPTENMIYYLTVTSAAVCPVTDSVIITVKERKNIAFLPGIFSPNGDGYNDVFRVRGENISEINFIIYNRWGEKVFETTDKAMGWDGTYKGKILNAAVFVYFLKVTFENGTVEELKGNVTLVR